MQLSFNLTEPRVLVVVLPMAVLFVLQTMYTLARLLDRPDLRDLLVRKVPQDQRELRERQGHKVQLGLPAQLARKVQQARKGLKGLQVPLVHKAHRDCPISNM